jgi:hypothetical protein
MRPGSAVLDRINAMSSAPSFYATVVILLLFAEGVTASHHPNHNPGGSGGGQQGGGSTTSKCATDGSDYKYTEAVAGTTRTVVTPWCPNHYFDDGNLNPNSAYTKGDVTLTMPASPMLEPSATDDVSGQGGGVGVLFNGAMLYSPFAGTVTLDGWATSATKLEGDTFDKCGCHSSSTSAAGYHCHIPPSCLLHQLGQTSQGHSPQVGWAPDGFPVYGPRTIGGGKIKLCSASNTDTTYCLDECSGLEKEIPGLDDFKYRYYIQGEDYLDGSHPTDPLAGTDSTNCNKGRSDCINPLSTEPYYPFTPRCYRGCCPSGVACSGSRATIPTCSNSATAGTTSAYTAAPAYPSGLPVYNGEVMSNAPGSFVAASAKQACSAAAAGLTCTSPAIKDNTGTCAGETCEASVDFGDSSKACCMGDVCDDGAKVACSNANKEACTAGTTICGNCANGFKADGDNCVNVCDAAAKKACTDANKLECSAGATTCGTSVDVCDAAAKKACTDVNKLECSAGATTCGNCASGFKADGNNCVNVCDAAAKKACTDANKLECSAGATTCGTCKSGFKADGANCVLVGGTVLSPSPSTSADGSSPVSSPSPFTSAENNALTLIENGGVMTQIAGGIKTTAALMLMLSLVNFF